VVVLTAACGPPLLKLLGDMDKTDRYVVLETAWGLFGLLGTDECLKRTSLPVPDRTLAIALITRGQSDLRRDDALLTDLQHLLKAYFDGDPVDFTEVAVDTPYASPFAQRVLSACRQVRYAETVSYRALAARAGSPHAARAAGSVMAANPMPLIIPCHRIIRSDGQTGNFSASGGPDLKKRLLTLEARGIASADVA